MNWLQKIDFMIAEKKRLGYGGEYRIDVTPEKNTWKENELESIVEKHPWIPKEYVNFIKHYDNIGIAWVTFYGSEDGKIIPLGKEIEYWREESLPDEYFPFGKYVDGSIFCFIKDGAVIFFDKYDYEFEHPKKIAYSFDDFMENGLLKDKLGDFESTKDTSFYQFMKHQGWID